MCKNSPHNSNLHEEFSSPQSSPMGGIVLQKSLILNQAFSKECNKPPSKFYSCTGQNAWWKQLTVASSFTSSSTVHFSSSGAVVMAGAAAVLRDQNNDYQGEKWGTGVTYCELHCADQQDNYLNIYLRWSEGVYYKTGDNSQTGSTGCVQQSQQVKI